MNANEAKSILLLYRPGTTDAADPQIAEALALAQRDPELNRWLDAQTGRQRALREKFRQATVPAGLMEQIISEHAANQRPLPPRQKFRIALVAGLLVCGLCAWLWFPQRLPDDTLAIYQNQMARIALSPYAMDLATNDPAPIRVYLAANQAPADFVLPAPLQQATVSGCAVENWQGVKVAMICFQTGRPLAPNTASDLWLFVVDRAAVKNLNAGASPQIAKVNRLITATWVQGDKLYLLGTEGGESAIKQYL